MATSSEDLQDKVDLVGLEELQTEHMALLERVKELEGELSRVMMENELLLENRALREMLVHYEMREAGDAAQGPHGHDGHEHPH